IGPARANAIFVLRNRQGRFEQITDLQRVPGIGEKTLERLEAFVTVGAAPAGERPNFAGFTRDDTVSFTLVSASATEIPIATQPAIPLPGISGNPPQAPPPPPSDSRININSATAEELQTLPDIGPARAADIIEHRIKHGYFQRPEDLMKVKGIGEKIFEKNRDRIRAR
ncbi:helix-hairpin-helix domain-containing protein, partial [bacterium]|nr:helix-hairpin-helix domain-containing protein [bacterium]